MAKLPTLAPKRFLGTSIPNTKVLGSQIQAIENVVNNIANTDGSIENSVVKPASVVAINATATATAAQIATGLITSTSGAATSIKLQTATLIASELKAVQGSVFDFTVDNISGSNIVTVIVGSGITVLGTIVITGSATLTVAATSLAVFRLVFTSATAAKLIRMA